ncbi:MAG TPA: serine/threonine-protein kinase [Polyangiaceae bacterium]|nr:serine/threonine-protein kinase [Polyangiaceae bacterium]
MSGQASTNLQSRRETALRAVGMTVGQRWTLLGVIGSGGTATVYEAVHRNGSRVAVKLLHADFLSHDRIRRRFHAEGYAANLVRHEGAVKVLDDGETDDGSAYLVMELLEGETLAARLVRNGPLPSDQVLAWGIAVLEILASAHEHHVVHRDVKPSNIFITHRGQVKLLDFGIARILDDPSSGEFATQQGVALGTPAFMAPEQATGSLEEIGAATDVWGVGATLFQLLTGRPIQEQHEPSAETDLAAPPVRAFAPTLSPELAKVVDRALRLRTSDRWPTARAMIRALELARDAPLNPPVNSAHTLTEEAVIVPKTALISRQHVAFAALCFGLTLAGGLYWALNVPPASVSHPVAAAAVAPASLRKAPAALASTVPSIETAVAAVAEAAGPARATAASAFEKQEHAALAPPRRKSSEVAPVPAKVVAPRSATPPPVAPSERAGDLDSILDRRK